MRVWRSVDGPAGGRAAPRSGAGCWLVRFVEEGQNRSSLQVGSMTFPVGCPCLAPSGQGDRPGCRTRTQMRTPDTTTTPRRRARAARSPRGPGARGARALPARASGWAPAGSAWSGGRTTPSSSATWRSRWCPRGGGDAERARVTREALAAARLNHPGIVALYEFGSDDRTSTWSPSSCTGATLEELSAEGALSDRDVARIGPALCDALEHAHARGVIHRDVKPANVMVLAEPAAGAGFAKLTDFGIAHLASGEDLTATGDVVGTLAYMAPEQAEGRRVTGGVRRLLAGADPLRGVDGHQPRSRGESPAATARRLGSPLPPLRSSRPDLPPELCEVIDAALDPDPSYRPAPAELREVLRDVEDDLSDEGGLVEPETLERFGLTAVRARTRVRTLLHRHAPGAEPVRPAGTLGAALAPRLAAGPAAGLLVLAALETLGPAPPFSRARRGWQRGAGRGAAAADRLARCRRCSSAAGSGTPEADRPGTALVLAAALVPTPLPAAARGPAVVGARAGAAAGRGRAGAAVRGRRRAGLDRLATRRAGGGRLPLAGDRRGDHGRRPAVRRPPTGPSRARAGRARCSTPGATPCCRSCHHRRWRRRWSGWRSPSLLPLVVRGRWAAARPAGRRAVGGRPRGRPRTCSEICWPPRPSSTGARGAVAGRCWAAWWPSRSTLLAPPQRTTPATRHYPDEPR